MQPVTQGAAAGENICQVSVSIYIISSAFLPTVYPPPPILMADISKTALDCALCVLGLTN